MDCTHAAQIPVAGGKSTSGNRELVPYLASAAKVFGVDGYFFETHPNPPIALSDGPNSIYLNDTYKIISKLI